MNDWNEHEYMNEHEQPTKPLSLGMALLMGAWEARWALYFVAWVVYVMYNNYMDPIIGLSWGSFVGALVVAVIATVAGRIVCFIMWAVFELPFRRY